MFNKLFILDIIISLTKVTLWERPVIPSCCLIMKGVNTKSKSSHAANDIMWEVEEHVFGETVGRMHNRGPVCRRSAPLVIGQAFTVVLSWVCAGKRRLILWMPGPEIHNKTIEMNALTIQQLLFENAECAKPSMADRIWEDQQSSDLEFSRMSACKIFFIVELLHRCKDALLLGTS
eukprot:1144615-Pelagomonas_calceolata.AAC.1